jgi:KamA family protein
MIETQANLKSRAEWPKALPAPRFQAFNGKQLGKIPQLSRLSKAERFDMEVVAQVLPFRVNQHVLDALIDWSKVPDDPMFRLVFPRRDMLAPESFARMAELCRIGAAPAQIQALADEIRQQLNPHPAHQQDLNVPLMDGLPVPGIQHKYRETVLFFPAQGQTCHSYCTFCFRWPQFVGHKEQRFAAKETDVLLEYLRRHKEATNLLITGGDPVVMSAKHLAAYIDPILSDPRLEHIHTLRIGTKSLSYWPQRFVSDADADELLRLFERVGKSGKQLAIMAHFNHERELAPPLTRRAIQRIRDTGAIIRSQSPVLRHINDDAGVWARMWRTQASLGVSPYYMFVERDTGARHYFELPLAEAATIYRDAIRQVSGLARTARGPSMSAGPGKVEIQGVAEIEQRKVFVLRFLQGRNPDWVQRPFFAEYDPQAAWFDQLKPAFGASSFFFQEEYNAMMQGVAGKRSQA